ncbi:hypothetical protein ANCCAN_00557 [Ancylostoma caninum]|uniref:Uncharacterized protein n=1 Tax=Ancylostoma caninum TaxID=29170 RepID=A0A368HA60_ANCCA|nr:hypothetical protein ANCCAN_00557 [Ancylostoma caninum]
MFLLIDLISLIIIFMLSLITCCRRREESEEAATENEDDDDDESGSSESAEGSLEGPLTASKEKPLEMSATNPQVLFVQQFQGSPTEEFVKNVRGVANSAAVFVWAAKKRSSALNAAWKDIARRIAALQSEGFDVLAGSVEAKELRRMESQRQTRPALLNLLEKMESKKHKKKKKKKKRRKMRKRESRESDE